MISFPKHNFVDPTHTHNATCKTYVIFLGSNTSSFSNFQSHGSTYDITGCQILGRWCVSFHESFAFRVSQNATFSSASFCYEASSTINSSGMELYKFIILIGKSLTECHGIAISSTSMGRCTRKVSTSISTSCQDSVLGANAMECSIFHIQGHDANTFLSIVRHE